MDEMPAKLAKLQILHNAIAGARKDFEREKSYQHAAAILMLQRQAKELRKTFPPLRLAS